MTTAADPWLNLGPATYVLDGVTHYFVATIVSEHFSNRNPRRTRPFRTGAKLDHTGSNPDEITLDCFFGSDVTEVDTFNEWPNDLERFKTALKTGRTGTLNLPWKRGLRVKCDEGDITTSASEHRGNATVRVKFCEDNEDNLDRAAVELVSVRSTMQSAVEAAQFDAESEGMDLLAIEDVTQLAADVVGLLNAPGDFAAALLHAGNRMRLAVKTVGDAFSTGAPGRNQLNGPEGALTRLHLLELAGLGARAVGEARPRPTRVMTFSRLRDIWSIATELGQNARELMTINEQIEDFAAIPAGDPVRVFV